MRFRDRKFEFVLYPKFDDDHAIAFQKIKADRRVEWLACVHDKDIDDNGELKKEHVHVLVFGFVNPVWSTALLGDYGLPENTIQPIARLRSAMRYLIHLDDAKKGKFPYSSDDVQGSVYALDQFEKACERDPCVEDGLRVLFDFILNCPSIVSYRRLFDFALDSGLVKIYQHYYKVLRDILDEHNFIYRKD